MKLQVFTVRDAAAGAYLQPYFARALGEAVRSFSEAVGNPEHPFAKHASDFTLYHVGEFDDNSGVISAREPYRVMSANECFGPDRVTSPTAALSVKGNGAAES